MISCNDRPFNRNTGVNLRREAVMGNGGNT